MLFITQVKKQYFLKKYSTCKLKLKPGGLPQDCNIVGGLKEVGGLRSDVELVRLDLHSHLAPLQTFRDQVIGYLRAKAIDGLEEFILARSVAKCRLRAHRLTLLRRHVRHTSRPHTEARPQEKP